MTFEHALAAALVVEAGAVVEAWALARARGIGDMALAGLAVALSVVVSAQYNYAQVAMAGVAAIVTDPNMLNALAYGPLAALVFFSLNFGRTVRRHDAEVLAYEKAQAQAAADKTAADVLARANERAAMVAASAAETARNDAARAARIEAEARERDAQRAHELELARIAQQAQAASPQPATRKPAIVGNAATDTRKQSATQAQPTTAQLVAEWRERNPNGTRAECAAAIKRHPANVGRQWEK
jgi:hypothetical protein